MIIRFKRFSERANVPAYAKPGDAGADLCVDDVGDGLVWPGKTVVLWTGIGVELQPGTFALVLPRSSTKRRTGLDVITGVIDSGYTGCIGVQVSNHSQERIVVKRGDRLAQLVVLPVVTAEFVEADELGETARGASGFGSTGGGY